MRMAKADNEDFETTNRFLQTCEMFWDNRERYSFIDKEGEWVDWDDEDEDKQYFLKVRKELAEEEDCDPEHVDNRLLVYEVIKRRYKQCDCNWRRVVFGAQILIEDVCDPQESHLAYSPYLEQFHVAPEQ